MPINLEPAEIDSDTDITNTEKPNQSNFISTAISFETASILFGDRIDNKIRSSKTRAANFFKWLYNETNPQNWIELNHKLPSSILGISKHVSEKILHKIEHPDIHEISKSISEDGTIKLLLSIKGNPVETVMIPTNGRITVCISSQSGCTRACGFCATAKMGFRKNLTAGEIVAQVLFAKSVAPKNKKLRNIVFMGMGEPLDNIDQVLLAISILSNQHGLNIAKRHITVSTSGVLPKMKRFIESTTALLAISLNATTEESRRIIMPQDKQWPLSSLIDFIKQNSSSRLFFIEYIVIKNLNDDKSDLDRLILLLKGLPIRLNLIPLNPHEKSEFHAPEQSTLNYFFTELNKAGIRTMIRIPRGTDISSACGQLYQHNREFV